MRGILCRSMLLISVYKRSLLLKISILKQLQVDPVDSIHQAHIMLNQSYLNLYRN
jgi:hypothetical protein